MVPGYVQSVKQRQRQHVYIVSWRLIDTEDNSQRHVGYDSIVVVVSHVQ